MSGHVQFVGKVTRVKTRTTKTGKEYYAYRLNIPKHLAEKLELNSDDDYLFVREAAKAKWYHTLNWAQMNTTWNMLPNQIKSEIISSGVDTLVNKPLEPQLVVASGVTVSAVYGITAGIEQVNPLLLNQR